MHRYILKTETAKRYIVQQKNSFSIDYSAHSFSSPRLRFLAIFSFQTFLAFFFVRLIFPMFCDHPNILGDFLKQEEWGMQQDILLKGLPGRDFRLSDSRA
jgi:hypothetical protein